MGFGELNDNLIKGLTRSPKLSWAGIYSYINMCIGSCIMESNKRKNEKDLLLKVKHIMKRNKKQVIMQ